jgi:uncharacterized membrane protein
MEGRETDLIASGRGVPVGNGWTWIADAWAFMGQQRGTFIGMFLIFAVIAIAVSLIPLAGSLAMPLLTPVLSAGFMLGCDALRRGERVEIGHLFAGFQNQTARLVKVGAIALAAGVILFLIAMLIVGADAMVLLFGGAPPTPEAMIAVFARFMLAMLVMLGLSVPLYMAMWFAAPLIVLDGYDVGTALKTSFFACLKNVLPFLVWSVVMLVLAIVASIPLMLGWLLLGPLLMVSIYVSYRDIFHAEQ